MGHIVGLMSQQKLSCQEVWRELGSSLINSMLKLNIPEIVCHLTNICPDAKFLHLFQEHVSLLDSLF